MSDAEKPLISIVTPVYNGGRYFEELIISIKDQIDSVRNNAIIEHVIINDGSNDDGVTQSIIEKFPHLRYISRENRGQYVSMNEGLDFATGKFVCFISADDLMAPGTLFTVAKSIIENPDCIGFWGKAKRIFSNGDFFEDQSILECYKFLYKYLSHIPHSSIYIERKYLLQHQIIFNTTLRYVSDYDWIVKLFQNKPKMKFIAKPLVYIRIHENQTTKRKFLEMELEKDYILRALNVSKILYSLIHFFQSSYSAMYRIIFRTRKYGIVKGGELFLYFIRHRLGLESSHEKK